MIVEKVLFQTAKIQNGKQFGKDRCNMKFLLEKIQLSGMMMTLSSK